MTAFAVTQAFYASEENMSRLAFRTGYYGRVPGKHFPKSEDSMFAKPRQRQNLRDQLAIARLATQVMSKEVH